MDADPSRQRHLATLPVSWRQVRTLTATPARASAGKRTVAAQIPTVCQFIWPSKRNSRFVTQTMPSTNTSKARLRRRRTQRLRRALRRPKGVLSKSGRASITLSCGSTAAAMDVRCKLSPPSSRPMAAPPSSRSTTPLTTSP